MTTIVKEINNIVYVEPNYSYSTDEYDTGGLETFEFIPNTEDYSIYVNLEIETIGRTIQTGNKVYRFSYRGFFYKKILIYRKNLLELFLTDNSEEAAKTWSLLLSDKCLIKCSKQSL